MTDFTKDELRVMAEALDMMVRSEGTAMAQAGATGLRDGRVALLTTRLLLGMEALKKVETAHHALVEADQAAVDAKPVAEAVIDPPVAGG